MTSVIMFLALTTCPLCVNASFRNTGGFFGEQRTFVENPETGVVTVGSEPQPDLDTILAESKLKLSDATRLADFQTIMLQTMLSIVEARRTLLGQIKARLETRHTAHTKELEE